jgi:DNA gyrase subunit A
MIPVREFSENQFLVMATRKGVVKRTSLSEYSRPRRGGIIAITLREGDGLIDVKRTEGAQEILLASRNGMAIRFKEEEVREIGRTGQGVKGIELREGDVVVDMVVTSQGTSLLTACEHGYGKRTALEEYRVQGRGGIGLINIQTEGRNGPVVGVKAVNDGDEVMLVSSAGIVIRAPVSDISVIGRNTMGVRLMRVGQGEKVTALAKVVEKEAENGKEHGEGEKKHGNGRDEGGEGEAGGKKKQPEIDARGMEKPGKDAGDIEYI